MNIEKFLITPVLNNICVLLLTKIIIIIIIIITIIIIIMIIIIIITINSDHNDHYMINMGGQKPKIGGN